MRVSLAARLRPKMRKIVNVERSAPIALVFVLQAACSGSVISSGSVSDRPDGAAEPDARIDLHAAGSGGAGVSGSGGFSTASGGASAGSGGAFDSGGMRGPGTGGASGSGTSTDACALTNGGVETCDGVDNDCDGQVDEPGSPPGGIDFTSVESCGSCALNCTRELQYAYGPKCNAPASGLGHTPGSCDYGRCADGHYDRDGNRDNGCEYSCPFANTTDVGGPDGCGIDDDCNGLVDDGVDTCHDAANCGFCGVSCLSAPHVTAAVCASTSPGTSCDPSDPHCEVKGCEPGWADSDHDGGNGCEAWTGPPPTSSVEVCDGYDNDGDGATDERGAQPDGIDGTADPSDSSHHIGDACGETTGECTAGNYFCFGGRFICIGGVGPRSEICDGRDNDCDGSTDEDPVDPSLEPPVCPGGARCAQIAPGLFECVSPCQSGEFVCPTTTECRSLPLSANPTETVRACATIQ